MRAPHFWINVLHKMYVKVIEDEDKVKHLSRAGIQVSVPSPISSLTVKLWLWLFTIPASPGVMSTSPSWDWISWKQRYSGRHHKKDWSVWLLSYVTQMWTVLHISAVLAPCSHVLAQSQGTAIELWLLWSHGSQGQLWIYAKTVLWLVWLQNGFTPLHI